MKLDALCLALALASPIAMPGCSDSDHDDRSRGEGDPAETLDHRAVPCDPDPGPRDAIVHLFQWPWTSIARECTEVLGPEGWGGIQVSPPQEHVVLPGRGFPWWQDYQPVSYQLVTRRGDRAAFAAMVEACHAAGVKIYVDAILNHMAGGASTGPGSAGSSYSQYDYPAVPYGDGDFHHCGRNGNDDIQNWIDRFEVQNCELVDLSDLKTESSRVREELTAYLNDLISLGVDGFRIDAAKHVPVGDLAAVFAGLEGEPFIYSEVIEGAPGEISPTEYIGPGQVTEFRYGDRVGGAFRDANLAGLNDLAGQMLLPTDDALVFIDNHDSQRNGRARLTHKDGTLYALAEAFMLAFPYGTPQVMSSFDFSSSDQGPPADAGGTTTPVACASGGWICEHRNRTTANLVGFHNQVHGTGVTDWWTNGTDQIAFGRGHAGFVVFNRSGAALTRTFQTGLPAGTYCDVANGDLDGESCTGPTYAVDEAGKLSATVGASAMLALHSGARVAGGGCDTVAVAFAVDATTIVGENIFVAGDQPALGNWDPAGAAALSSATYPVWRGTVTFPAGAVFEYKYIKKVNGGGVIWETGANRVVATGEECAVTLNDSWRN